MVGCGCLDIYCMSYRLSVYISYFDDLHFLRCCIDNIYSIAHEIIVVDGPFEFMIADLQLLRIALRMSDGDVESLLLDYPKVRYFHGVFAHEMHKRVFAYEQCVGDLVLVLDTDEMIHIVGQDICDFYLRDDCLVGGVSIVNLCLPDHCFDAVGSVIHVCRLFKKHRIGALRHLDYLWLFDHVPHVFYDRPLIVRGIIYHYCLLRSVHGLLVKYLFYVNLHELNHSDRCAYGNSQELSYLSQLGLSVDVIKRAFVRGRVEGLGLPLNKPVRVLDCYDWLLDEQRRQIVSVCGLVDLRVGDVLLSGVFARVWMLNCCTLVIELDQVVVAVEYRVMDAISNREVHRAFVHDTQMIGIRVAVPGCLYVVIYVRGNAAVYTVRRVSYVNSWYG